MVGFAAVHGPDLPSRFSSTTWWNFIHVADGLNVLSWPIDQPQPHPGQAALDAAVATRRRL